jgi:excisionase family DNA binding protein
MDTLFTLAEVAEYFRVDERTVRNWIKAHMLMAHKVGGAVRIRQHDIESFLEKSSTK